MPERQIDRKLGTLSPVIYFENSNGDIVLPPDTENARYYYAGVRDARGKTYQDWGFEWREAETLDQVRKLERKLQEQDRRETERLKEKDSRLKEGLQTPAHERLRARMVSSATSPWERDFIELWLKLRDEKKAEYYKKRYEERAGYLWALQFDSSSLPQDRLT